MTLKSGKVYIGLPKRHSPDHDHERIWLSLWPVASGLRNSTDGKLTIQTYYPGKDQIINLPGAVKRLEDFQCVIPLSEISSVQSFDLDTYAKFPGSNASSVSTSLSEGQTTSTPTQATPPFPPAYPSTGESVASRLVEVILTKRDRYKLRIYSYYIATLTGTFLLLPFSIWWAFAMAAVSIITAIEAIKPIQVRWMQYKEKKAKLAMPASATEDLC